MVHISTCNKTLMHINKINESKKKNITEMTEMITNDSHFLSAFSAAALV